MALSGDVVARSITSADEVATIAFIVIMGMCSCKEAEEEVEDEEETIKGVETCEERGTSRSQKKWSSLFFAVRESQVRCKSSSHLCIKQQLLL